jgi:hypothetical protein
VSADQRIDHQPARPPSRALWLAEFVRAPYELAGFYAAFAGLAHGRRGDGHPVLVLPGLLADDVSTAPLRAAIAARGLVAVPWRMGPNLGPTPEVLRAVPRRLAELHEQFGTPVSIVGWSLGGILAREFARRSPEHVRQVVTLGSPFRLRTDDPPGLSNGAGEIYAALRPIHDPSLEYMPHESELGPLPCPATSIYSRTDGIVPWQSCLDVVDATHENVEVRASHCGLGVSPQALAVVLDRLVQAQGQWRPYAGSVGATTKATS